MFNIGHVEPEHAIYICQCSLYPYLLLDNLQNGTAILLHADDHTDIYQSTKSASDKWRAIGEELGFTFDELDPIVREPGQNEDVDYCHVEKNGWTGHQPTIPSIQCLLSALRCGQRETSL